MGYRVAVLEKRSRVGEKACCTGIISRECVSAYSIPDEVIFRKANSAKIFSPHGEHIRVYRPETQACILKRGEFDRLLAGRAVSAGVEFSLSTEVKNIVFQTDRVILESTKENRPFRFESKVVIAASGFNVNLIRQFGLARTSYCVSGAQAELVSRDVQEVEVYFDQKLAPGFFAWIVPTDQERCLVGLLAHRTPGVYLKNWLAKLEKERNIRPGDAPIRYGSIPLRPLKRTYGERFLIAGDAAGQVKPTTGGGIYFGLLCADIAADTLNRAFTRGDFSARMLSEYEQSWEKRLGHELRTEYYARKIYEHLSDKQLDSLFTRLKKTGLVESILQQDDFSFDWHGGLLLKAVKLGAASGVKHIVQFPARLFRG
jgi:digeranylgeranylglycerophospholipid reductase